MNRLKFFKKLFCVFVSILLAATIIPGEDINNDELINSNFAILEEIDETVNKILIKNEIIGDRQVKYWEHYIDDILVKNNSMLLHKDIDSDEIILFEKNWNNIEFDLSINWDEKFEPDNYLWKTKIVFLDVEDCSYFYSFYDSYEFPLACWEVRHSDGTTILYNQYGTSIGYGIPSPSEKGFSISNDCSDGAGDCWSYFRQNADEWFRKWCNSAINIGLPNLENISKNVRDKNTTFFYELGHSHYLPTRFLITDEIYYNASILRNDMDDRPPMKFAFIGSCEGMREIGPGTLSYEFRKGEITDTVTVGYIGMSGCTGWSVAIPWQDYMFQMMDNGSTIKESFDLASAKYPLIADCVRFYGDENLKVNNPPKPPSLEGSSDGVLGNSYNFSFYSADIDRDDLLYFVDFGDGNVIDWIGPYAYEKKVTLDHIFYEKGLFNISVKSKDPSGLESGFSTMLVNISGKGKVRSFDILSFDFFGSLIHQYLDIILMLKSLIKI